MEDKLLFAVSDLRFTLHFQLYKDEEPVSEVLSVEGSEIPNHVRNKIEAFIRTKIYAGEYDTQPTNG